MKKNNLVICNEKDEIDCEIYFAKRPYIIFNDVKYEAYIPGETLIHEYIKNPKPLPSGVYGFIVSDFIILKIKNDYKILNPGYSIYTKENKKNDLVLKILCPIIVLILLVLLVVLSYLKG